MGGALGAAGAPRARSGARGGHAAAVLGAGLLVAAAVAEAVVFDGGFSPASRVAFAALAAAALLAVAARAPRLTAKLAREPVVVTLLALAVLGGASTAWTV